MKNIRKLLKLDEMALIFTEQNRFYLTGFASSYGILLVLKNSAYLLIDGRYFEAAQNSVSTAQVVLLNKPLRQISEIAKQNKITKIFTETEISVSQLRSFEQCDGVLVEPSNKLTDTILVSRSVKTETEIECILGAQRIAEKALERTLPKIQAGITEKQIAAELEYQMKLLGADGISFETIAISGKNTSMPHGVPTDKKVQNGEFITLDFGAIYKGYHSDMTRTLALGNVSEKMKNIYNIVLSSNIESINSVKAGISAKDVDKVARNVISDAGFGEMFVHSTGHGVGIDIHELPNISFKNTDCLKKNQIITIEPGIYIPNEFGVRIEDMVVVNDDSCRNLTNFEKSLIII